MMPEAFITEKTPDEVTVDFGSGDDDADILIDGNMVIRKGEKFFNWSFDQLQDTDAEIIEYVED
jgi:hypothetical protein